VFQLLLLNTNSWLSKSHCYSSRKIGHIGIQPVFMEEAWRLLGDDDLLHYSEYIWGLGLYIVDIRVIFSFLCFLCGR